MKTKYKFTIQIGEYKMQNDWNNPQIDVNTLKMTTPTLDLDTMDW